MRRQMRWPNLNLERVLEDAISKIDLTWKLYYEECTLS